MLVDNYEAKTVLMFVWAIHCQILIYMCAYLFIDMKCKLLHAIFSLASALICCLLLFARTAYDVSLNDDSWPPEAFQLVSGSTSKIVEKLEPSVHFLIHLILPFPMPVFSLDNVPFVLPEVLLRPTTLFWRPTCREGFRVLLL